MRSMTFLINDASTDTGYPDVWVTITENLDGTLTFSITQPGNIIGDLRGIFFDVYDESLINTLQVTSSPSPTQVIQGNDTITTLGSGATMEGLLGSDGGYDVGIEIGTSGMNPDDIQNYQFTLSSTARALTLEDFAYIDFAVRLTSVGLIDGSRENSSKILETTPPPINAIDDSASVEENHIITGNILSNDSNGLSSSGTITLTGWSGGSFNEPILLENGKGATLQLNSDGSYILDASTADALAEGEHLEYVFNYSVHYQHDTTSFSTDSAQFTIHVYGKNDAPVAADDSYTLDQNTTLLVTTNGILANDFDIDGDPLSAFLVNGPAHGTLSLNADGSFGYTPHANYYGTDSFTYKADDGYTTSNIATVNLTITQQSAPPPDPFDFPTTKQAISNIVLYLDDNDPSTDLYKLKITPSFKTFDADNLDIDFWLSEHGDIVGNNTDLVAFSLHAGKEYPLTAYDIVNAGAGKSGKSWTQTINPLGPGEGQLYIYGDGSYNPGEADYKPTAANPGPTDAMLSIGLTELILAAKANYEVIL